MLESFLLVIIFAYCAGNLLTHAALLWGILVSRRSEVRRAAKDSTQAAAAVSVIVPARNEEQNLPALFASLEGQDLEGLEIVLVDDRSTDGTAALMAAFAARRPDRTIVVRVGRGDVPEPGVHGNPKLNALVQGVAAAHGDILLLTDADCVHPCSWARRMSSYFRDPELGLVFSSVSPQDDSTPVVSYQTFDHLLRYYYTVGCAGMGMPTGGFGNNMAVRRNALTAIGGLTALRQSATEDAELIAQVRASGRWRILALCGRDTAVRTAPQARIGQWMRQALRWNAGGLFAPDPLTRLSYRWVMCGLTAAVLLSPVGFLHAALFLPLAVNGAGMLAMALCGLVISRPRPLYALRLVLNIPAAVLLYSLSTVLSLSGRAVVWKGQRLKV